MATEGLPSVAQLKPLVIDAVRTTGGRASTAEIREKVGASFEASLLAVRHGTARGGEIAYRIRWAILDLRRDGVIERVAPKTYALTGGAGRPI
jgi:hypothetical protein